MKGSSSAGLPAINEVRSLVANPCANPKPKKRNKDKEKKSKERKAMKISMAKQCCENDILSKHEECSTSKNDKMESKGAHEKNENLEERKMAEMEAFFRGKRGKDMHFNPYREQSGTSLQKRRLASAKSRDHLLSLIPSKETSRTYINEDLVVSAKQELEMIRRHTNRLLGRDEASGQGSIYHQSLRASKLREMTFGTRDKTNNNIESHDHVMDLNSRRTHFLAPMSASHNKTNSKEIKTCFSENIRDIESRNKDEKCNTAQISLMRSATEFDFYA